MTELDSLEPWHDFSVVLGGPLFQLLRKTHLEGDHLEHLKRRLVIITLFAWLPLLLLSTIGSLAGNPGRLSFLHDVEVQVRFLIALPILIAAELIVHLRLRLVVRRFVERRLISQKTIPTFDVAVNSAKRVRDSIPVECGLLLFVYGVGLWVWHNRVTVDSPTWYALPGGRWHLTLAGFWYVFVSIPILQFILLRWYLRFFIWFRFLWQVSRINLHLVPTHPDRCAGLAFLGKSAYAFSPILFAQGVMLAGVVASRVLYHGEKLESFKLQAGGFVVIFVLAILGPLLMFTPQMARAKRTGLAIYGQLAQNYVDRFEQKWGEPLEITAPSEELLGSADIQSLADLGNSYAMVREMRSVPFGLDDISRMAAATAAPLVPLLLTVFSPEELILRIIKIVF
ncbi:hypothetical protein [Alloacidobacterium sp.]|uniref:hypothetical protein n=1 Tax=Alloacidobacterium sp. TaxID=2951999 RepID=UPI002D732713|nr:hypothetical protein [Alloacidobacterium sp.]HYK35178.1 hypothetical protein [Alloacidobacterium sp.]